MTRTLLAGGRVFDGSGAPAADADVLMEDGRILEVGPGLDGDEAVDVGGRHLLPGLFDCHTHVTLTSVDLMGILQAPFSYRFFETVQNLAAILRVGITAPRPQTASRRPSGPGSGPSSTASTWTTRPSG